MENSLAIVVGMISLLLTGKALALSGNMMNGGMSGTGWMGGGYGGAWGPILLLIVVIGLVVWAFQRKGK